MAAKIISIQSTMLVILKQRDLLDNEEGEREREREGERERAYIELICKLAET